MARIIINMSADITTKSVTTIPNGVSGAEGVESIKWFIAIVRHNTEKSSGEQLAKRGYECYVPIQSELRIWKNGRKNHVDRVVIPSIVFIHCTETQRKEIVSLPFISRFMTNKAGSTCQFGHKPLATVPEVQIEKLKFMLGNSDTPVTFSSQPYKKGDFVKVVRGYLIGLIGEVQIIDSKHCELTISLEGLGNARLAIETVNVEPISVAKD